MAEIIDIEEYATKEKQIPVGAENHYRVRVNTKAVVLPKRFNTGEEILIAAGYNPENSNLMVHYRGKNEPSRVGNKDKIDLIQGVQRFTQVPTQAQFGIGV